MCVGLPCLFGARGGAAFAYALHHFLTRCARCGSHYFAAWWLACAAPEGLAPHGDRLGALAFGGAKAFNNLYGNLLAGEFFNGVHEAFFVQTNEAHGLPLCACAACAANAVYVVFGHVGYFVIDDVWQVININAACGNISGYQRAQSAAFEVAQGLRACRLAFVAVQGHGADALFVQVVGHMVGTEFGAGKDQHLAPVVFAYDVRQQLFLFTAAYWQNGLRNALHGGVARGDLHLLRVAQQGGCQLADFIAESGTKQQALLVGWQQRQHFFHVMDKAHVEHAVGLIKHQNFYAREVKHALTLQIEQAPRCGYQNIYAFFQALDLCIHAHAAKNNG